MVLSPIIVVISWHKKGLKFGSDKISGLPFDWKTALRLKGAWDVSFAKWIFETYDLFDLEPFHRILNETKEIRMAVSGDMNKIAIYAPYNTPIYVDMDLSKYDFTLINMAERYFAKPDIICEENVSIINAYDFNCDVLLLGRIR